MIRVLLAEFRYKPTSDAKAGVGEMSVFALALIHEKLADIGLKN